MTIAAYVRVSSASQHAGMQRDAILSAARARGDLVPQWYAETFSGATTKRPELERLRRDVRAGSVRKIYVWRLDRLTRSGIRDTMDLVEEFARHGCELVTLTDGFDLQGPAGEIVIAVLAWAAKMERQAITERVHAARERARARGESWGRPRRMQPWQEKQVLELALSGKSVREIAQTVKVPRSTVGRVLSQKSKRKRGPKKALPRRLYPGSDQ